ncbi:MAG TPA: toll/interleukin-1 receptor domain-containing protein [Blastocatellia bacterium]|nr:toll/interleukin-1 receptor domain-containing protein [Blastocatellia bacterium]
MANKKHLAILRQGVRVWNKWLNEHPKIRPDLSESDLQRANLSHAHLNLADLSYADLSHANLSHAQLNFADLSYADLFGADLRESALAHADLTMAILSSARLGGAQLMRTNLYTTRLEGTDFAGSDCIETLFVEVDLSTAVGLDTILHGGPSDISIGTLCRSAGKIPEAFLRGCGVPDDFITFIPSLFTAEKAIQFYSCFISYSSKNQDFAERLHSDLRGKHIRVWFAPEDLKIGDRFPDRIEESIRLYDKLLLILSADSIESSWVEREVRAALEKEESKCPVLFPIRLDDAVMDCNNAWAADIRRTRHIGDFTRWKDYDAYQKSFERLLRDLQPEPVG